MIPTPHNAHFYTDETTEPGSRSYIAAHTTTNDSSALYKHVDQIRKGVPSLGLRLVISRGASKIGRRSRRARREQGYDVVTIETHSALFPIIRWKDLTPSAQDIEREIFTKSSLFTYVSFRNVYKMTGKQQEFLQAHQDKLIRYGLSRLNASYTISTVYSVGCQYPYKLYFLRYDLTSIPLVSYIKDLFTDDIQEVKEFNEWVKTQGNTNQDIPLCAIDESDRRLASSRIRCYPRVCVNVCFMNRWLLSICVWTLCYPFLFYPCFRWLSRSVEITSTKMIHIGHPYYQVHCDDDLLTNEDRERYNLYKQAMSLPSH